jgi:hypothetical protein
VFVQVIVEELRDLTRIFLRRVLGLVVSEKLKVPGKFDESQENFRSPKNVHEDAETLNYLLLPQAPVLYNLIDGTTQQTNL